jgi:membrane-bound ClpP family serine protease
VLVGLVLDSVARRNEAFWWHAVGLLALAVGLTWYGFFRNAGWAWIAMLIVGAVLVLASAPFDRATWTTFGVLGVFGAALNYASDWLGSWKSPALMVAVSLGLLLLGMVLSVNARAWAARLRRTPPAEPPEAPAAEQEPLA